MLIRKKKHPKKKTGNLTFPKKEEDPKRFKTIFKKLFKKKEKVNRSDGQKSQRISKILIGKRFRKRMPKKETKNKIWPTKIMKKSRLKSILKTKKALKKRLSTIVRVKKNGNLIYRN